MFQIEGLDHVALAVRDVRASAAWYQEVLGLQREHEAAWGDHPAFVSAGNTGLALFPVEGPAQPLPGRHALTMRHVAFRVDRANLERAKAELALRRIAFSEQDHGIARSIYFLDPDGHELELTTYEASSP